MHKTGEEVAVKLVCLGPSLLLLIFVENCSGKVDYFLGCYWDYYGVDLND